MPLKRPSGKVLCVVKVLIVILYLLCCSLEFACYRFLLDNVEVVCIKFNEISKPVRNALIWANVAIVPDLVAAILGLPLIKLYHHALGIVYNLAVGCFIISSSLALTAGLTYCGQPIQLRVATVATALLAAGIVHLFIAALHLLLRHKCESYLWRKMTKELCKTFSKKLSRIFFAMKSFSTRSDSINVGPTRAVAPIN